MTHYSGVSVRHAKRAFLVQNLLIINLIFVLRNMPRAFFPFTPLSFIHLSLPHSERVCLCAMDHTYSDYSLHPHLSLQLLPSVFSHFVLPCIHFSDLVTHSDAVCLHTNFARELRNGQYLSSHRHNLKGGSSKRQFEASWKHSSRLSSPNSVFVSLSGLFVRWKDYLIVYRFRACLQSICCVYGACCLTMKDYWELLFVCVCLCIWLDNLL